MFSNIILNRKVGSKASLPEVSLTMIVIDGVDHDDAIVMKYPETKMIGILTASLRQPR